MYRVKRFSCILIIILAAIVVASCSNEADEESKRQSIEDSILASIYDETESSSTLTEASTSSIEMTSSATPSPTPSPTPTPQITVYQIHGIEQGFHEERAWVWLERPSSYSGTIALIDKDGRIIYKAATDQLRESIGINNIWVDDHVTQMAGGYSVLYFAKSPNGEAFEEFLILDKNGKETYFSDDGDENTHYLFIAQFEDRFLVLKQTSSFSDNSRVLQLIDPYGNVILDKLDFGIDLSSQYAKIRYYEPTTTCNLGNGLYSLIGVGYDASDSREIYYFHNIMYNYGANSFINMHDYKVAQSCKDGNIILDGHSNDVDLSPKDFADQLSFDEAIQKDENIFGSRGRTSIFGMTENSYNEGKYFDSYTHAYDYKDKKDNVVVTVEKPDTVSVSFGTPFTNNCAYIRLIGADGKQYHCHIDENGKFMYQPIVNDEDLKYIDFDNGYCFLGTDYDIFDRILTPDGRFLFIGTDDISEIGDISDIGPLSEGYYRTDKKSKYTYFRSADGKILDTCYELEE